MKLPALTYATLLIAIVCETAGTSFLKQSEQFTRPLPSVLAGLSYAASFYFLSVTLKVMPVGVAYAVWSGLGVILITAVGLLVFKQQLDLGAYIGLGLIVAGVVTLNLFSRTIGH